MATQPSRRRPIATSPSASRRRPPPPSPSRALAVGVWQVRSVIILLLLAVTLAAAIRPGVEWLGRHRVPQSLAILLHFLVVGGAVALLVWLAVPPAIHQIGHALDNVSPLMPTGVRAHGLDVAPAAPPAAPDRDRARAPGRHLRAQGGRGGRRGLLHRSPPRGTASPSATRSSSCSRRSHPRRSASKARETYLALDDRLGAYTRLRFLMVFAVGAVLSAGFYVVGLNYWLLVGAFVGLVEIVPVVGPLVASILVLAVGLPQSLHVALLSLLWLVVVREFQSYVVNPHIGQTVGLSPLVTLLSVAVVGVLFGGLAVILAVPFTSAVATLIDVLVLGHEPPTEQPRRSLRLRRSG